MRTQEEIAERFKNADDLFGTQQSDLIEYMTFDNAKPHLIEDYVKKVNDGKEEWEQRNNPLKEIQNYIDFAYGKAHGERGLSAGRSMLHFKTWIWLMDDGFYEDIEDEIDNYTDYGLPQLDKIAEKYNLKVSV